MLSTTNAKSKVEKSNDMRCRCGHCDEEHEIGDPTINIGDEGRQLIDDISQAL
jgi:hypothetical protein